MDEFVNNKSSILCRLTYSINKIINNDLYDIVVGLDPKPNVAWSKTVLRQIMNALERKKNPNPNDLLKFNSGLKSVYLEKTLPAANSN